MQPDCVCKARFFSKNVPISAKKFSRFQAIFTVFHRLSEDFQQRFPQFVERQNRPKFWEFFWVSGIFPSPFSTKIRFFVSTVSTCDFLKNFCRSIFFEFSTKFSTSFSFQLHNLSTFPHKFNNRIVEKKISNFAIFLTFPPFQQTLLLLIFLIFLFYQNDTHRTANTMATVETFHNF